MQFLVLLLIVGSTSEALLGKSVFTEKWNTFKKTHGRRFINFREELFRKKMFRQKLQYIEEHNKRYSKGMESYEIGVNQFSDYTDEEMLLHIHGLLLPLKRPEPFINITLNHSISVRNVATALPDSFDWGSRGMVTPVKDQGNCASCWAFSTNSAIESHYKIHYGSTITLSEQQLVDCVTDSFGCSGGWMYSAYTYIVKNGGINYASDYPYEATNGMCRYQSSKPHVSIRGYAYLTEVDEELLKGVVVTQGPVVVAVDARGNFASYTGGVYYNPSCSTSSVSHAVVITGYGNENGQDYWLVKNSWGPLWGQDGYIKIARNRGNHCGIASYPSYPVF